MCVFCAEFAALRGRCCHWCFCSTVSCLGGLAISYSKKSGDDDDDGDDDNTDDDDDDNDDDDGGEVIYQ